MSPSLLAASLSELMLLSPYHALYLNLPYDKEGLLGRQTIMSRRKINIAEVWFGPSLQYPQKRNSYEYIEEADKS